MPGASSKVTYSPLHLPFSCSIYVKKIMKLLAFIFEHRSYADNQQIMPNGENLLLKGLAKTK